MARPTPSLPLRSLALACLLAACGETEDWSPLDGPWDPNDPRAAAILAPPTPGAPIDLEMAAAGERWYRIRGCLACHSLQGDEVLGPSLLGITGRRDYDWFRGMVMSPDSMLRVDPIAQALLERYRVVMPRQGLDDLRVRAIWEFHRQVDAAAP
jgi:hypothetical protein